MKIVIDIDENIFTRLFDNGIEDYEITNDDLFAIAKAIRGGTPLPEGHGRLLILDEAGVKKCFTNFDFSSLNWINEVAISMATLKILEADKGESK